MLDLYKNIKRLRKERGLSQDELAKLCGYTSRSSVNKIEQGLVDISISKVEAFANALGVEPNELIMFERPELRVLFDASRNVDKDDIIQVSKILEKLQRLEEGNGDD